MSQCSTSHSVAKATSHREVMGTKTFVQLVKLVQDHHQPAPSVTVRRFAFHSRISKEGESLAMLTL